MRAGPARSAHVIAKLSERLRWIPSLFGLAPCGVYPAICLTADAVRSYRTFSPLPCAACAAWAVRFLWHWPYRSLEAATPDVIRHTALRSSDFPLLFLA